ncbi:alpha/beta fold hydrolase [Yoonia litorea]|nr:alpha/beta hydrolase [Yoonia litorea]
MCDARLFGPQVAALEDARDVRVMPIHAHQTVAALANDILQDAPERFAIAGLSMGGIVAMEVLRQAPDRIAGLALMDTNPLAEAPEVAARRDGQIDKVDKGGLASVMRDEMKPNYLAQTSDREAILDLCMAMALDLGPQAFINQSRALAARPDQQGTLAAYRGPALVLCGAEDTLCPIHRHELMHALMPQSHLEIIPQAGHLPTLEAADQTTAALKHWLGTIPDH